MPVKIFETGQRPSALRHGHYVKLWVDYLEIDYQQPQTLRVVLRRAPNTQFAIDAITRQLQCYAGLVSMPPSGVKFVAKFDSENCAFTFRFNNRHALQFLLNLHECISVRTFQLGLWAHLYCNDSQEEKEEENNDMPAITLSPR